MIHILQELHTKKVRKNIKGSYEALQLTIFGGHVAKLVAVIEATEACTAQLTPLWQKFESS